MDVGKTVQDIIVERLINKINKEKKLPWQKPFAFASINWATEKEYVGINKILLEGGEYITPNQLKAYNEKNNVNYWFEKGTPYELVIFYGPSYQEISNDELEDFKKNGVPKSMSNKIVQSKGKYMLRKWILRYYKVYDIKYIKDKEGNPLKPKLGNSIIEKYENPEKIINRYLEGSGVKVNTAPRGEAYYTESDDTVYMPEIQYFVNSESYYRVMFHELAHSTGVDKRFNRECFKKYAQSIDERSREELIAEMSSLLLASESGFREVSTVSDNSDTYILSWLSWIENNPYEVVLGMQQAEKVKKYILNGGTEENYNEMETELAI